MGISKPLKVFSTKIPSALGTFAPVSGIKVTQQTSQNNHLGTAAMCTYTYIM